MTDRAATLRAFFARFVAARGGARDPRIEQAFAAVPREPFAGPQPWSVLALGWAPRPAGQANYVETPDDDPAFLYQDTLIALDPSRGIDIGEPSLHARCFNALSPQEGNTVLHVGAGSGYYTALLAQLVGPTGRVHAYDIDPELAGRAARNLAHLPQVVVHLRGGVGDGLRAPRGGGMVRGQRRRLRTWPTMASITVQRWRARSGQSVNAACIVPENHRAFLCSHWDFESRFRIVVVPVRIVGSKHQPVPANPIERVAQVLLLLGLLNRLRSEPQ